LLETFPHQVEIDQRIVLFHSFRELPRQRPFPFILTKDSEGLLDQKKGIGVYFRGSPGGRKENCSEGLLVR